MSDAGVTDVSRSLRPYRFSFRAMASSQQIDPRLSGTSGLVQQYAELAQKSPQQSQQAQQHQYSHSQPQPYYNYPTSQPVGQGDSGHGQPTHTDDVGHAIPDHESPEQDDGQSGEDPKRPRACEACRGLKVRCDQDPTHPEIPCRRCAKAGRQCIITQPSRKRQKKADTRVAELEKKLDALTAVLHQQHIPGLPSNDIAAQLNHATSLEYATAEMSMPPTKRRRVEDHDEERGVSSSNGVAVDLHPVSASDPENSVPDTAQVWARNTDLKSLLHDTTPEDFVNRINALISPELAATIFDRYNTKLSPLLPAVVFPSNATAKSVFKEKPILYICILSAASFGTLHPDVSRAIAREAVGAIADCVVRNGAKSLELVQAMQVTALWYKPPEQAEQTNFYQMIHMAAVMALDIGLGKRFNASKARRGFGGPNANYTPGPHKTLPQDSDTLEARRAWLTSYYLCAG